MTIPSEEVRAVEAARDFLMSLINRDYHPGRRELRARALMILRHFPWTGKMEEIYRKAGADLWPLKVKDSHPYVPREDTRFAGIPYVLSGICRCGHRYQDHHDGGLAQALGGAPAECEYYGSNEAGGQKPTRCGKWVYHCGGYCDTIDPDRERHSHWEKKVRV